LFDAAGALIGIAHESTYEGQVAMQLEALSVAGGKPIAMTLERRSDGLLSSDWSQLLPALMSRVLSPEEKGSVFHSSLAATIAEQADAIRQQTGIGKVGLSGGVFQNRLLTQQALSTLTRLGFEVFLHEAIPSGDGGISFGQIIESGPLTHA
jgi:hydrogenase maturation protein HypF